MRSPRVIEQSNLSLVVRERGKIVTRRDGHNIWVNNGRLWLANLISYSAFGPDALAEDNRIQYMGFGIGGLKQSALAVANNNPLLSHYPGPNLQSDIDATVGVLERPVRFGWAVGPNAPTGAYPGLIYDAGDVWLKAIQMPTGHPQTTSARFIVAITAADMILGSPYLTIPISEIGLFTAAADPHALRNRVVAYDTFDTIPKSGSYDITATWTVRF